MEKIVYYQIRKELKNYLSGTDYLEKTYCVGGCVRDLILDREIKDIDLVVEIPGGGIGLARYLEEKGALVGPPVVYENYGTTSFRLKNFPSHEIEAVQTRSEEYIDRSSRNPQVGYGSLETDWKRRDFTINSLYQSLVTENIYDYSKRGIEDIKYAETIRTTSDPDVIFYDDPLRMLRAIRFATVLRFGIENKTWDGIKKNASRLSIISKERVTAEISKILTSGDAGRGFGMLEDCGLLPFISEELDEATKMGQNKYHVGTVWDHTLMVLSKLSYSGADEVTMWSGLFHDIGKLETKTMDDDGGVHFYNHSNVGAIMLEKILRTDFRLPVSDIKKIQVLVSRHMDFKNITGTPKPKTLRRLQYLLGEEQYYRLLSLIEADNMSHAYGYCIEGQVDEIIKLTSEMKTLFGYKLPVTGEDIMRVRNIGPGKLVKGYLDYLMKLVFVNPDLSREELLKKIKNLSPKNLGKEYCLTENN